MTNGYRSAVDLLASMVVLVLTCSDASNRFLLFKQSEEGVVNLKIDFADQFGVATP